MQPSRPQVPGANRPTILDGGMGQELIARTKFPVTPLWSTTVMINEPEIVRDLHREYLQAGAEILTLANYSANPTKMKLGGAFDQFLDVHQSSARVARAAITAEGLDNIRLAGSMGPLTWSYQSDRVLNRDECLSDYRQVVAAQKDLVDLLIGETFTTLIEVETGTLAAVEAGVDVWTAVTVLEEDGSKIRSGETVAEAAKLAMSLGAQGVMINCSTPEAVNQGVSVLASLDIPFGAYANGFVDAGGDMSSATTAEKLRVRQDLSPAAYADFAQTWVDAGASIIGGCCEVGPSHIQELTNRLKLSS